MVPVPRSPSEETEQQINESVWCQMIVGRVLPLVLPPEDLENPCLLVLVSEVLSEMILHNGLLNKASESWLIWEGISKIVQALRPDLAKDDQAAAPRVDRLERYGLLSRVRSRANSVNQRQDRSVADVVVGGFWAAVQAVSVLLTLSRLLVSAWMQASTLPRRSSHKRYSKAGNDSDVDRSDILADDRETHPDHAINQSHTQSTPPILGMSIWSCVSKLTRLYERMPWLAGLLSLVQYSLLHAPGQVCRTNSRLDR
jgi:hypothetical protein